MFLPLLQNFNIFSCYIRGLSTSPLPLPLIAIYFLYECKIAYAHSTKPIRSPLPPPVNRKECRSRRPSSSFTRPDHSTLQQKASAAAAAAGPIPFCLPRIVGGSANLISCTRDALKCIPSRTPFAAAVAILNSTPSLFAYLPDLPSHLLPTCWTCDHIKLYETQT